MKAIIKVPFPAATDRVFLYADRNQATVHNFLPSLRCDFETLNGKYNRNGKSDIFLFALMWLSLVRHQQKITDGRGIEVVVGIPSVTIVVVAQVMYNRLDTWTRTAIKE